MIINQENSNEWLIRFIRFETTPEENKLVTDWINQDPGNRLQYEETKKIIDSLDYLSLSQTINIQQEILKFQKEVQRLDEPDKSRTMSMIRVFLRVAAVFVIGLGVSCFFIFRQHHVTVQSAAMVLTDTLPEGSVITLNKHSTITYSADFEKNRNVFLEGEAFFNVTPDINNPFTVSVGNYIVKVLGTSFNIKAINESDSLLVEVYSGRVQLCATNDRGEVHTSIVLNKGESARCQGVNILPATVQNDNAISWKTGVIEFNNNQLSHVFQVLGEHYGVVFDIQNDSLLTKSFTSRFENQSLENILEMLQIIFRFEALKTNDSIVIRCPVN